MKQKRGTGRKMKEQVVIINTDDKESPSGETNYTAMRQIAYQQQNEQKLQL